MKESGLAVQLARDTSFQKGKTADLAEPMNNPYDRIACRAFEIFEGNGRDLGDWFQAEAEFLHPLHLEISESPEAFTIRAEVPGFKMTELQVNVEPRRVTITGLRETKEESKTEKLIYSETCSDQILRVLDLPAEVKPDRVKSTLKDGVLELAMQKATPAKTAKSEPKVA